MTANIRGGIGDRRRHPHLKFLMAPALVCAEFLGLPAHTHAQQVLSQQQTPALPLEEGEDANIPPLVRSGWTFSAMGRGDITFTDNAYLTNTNKTSDVIFSPTAVFGAKGTGARSIFDGSLLLAYDAYAGASDISGHRVKALADGTIRFMDDTVSLRGRAATDLQPSSYLGAVPATERNIGGNQVQALTYGLSPSVDRPLNDRISVEAAYDFSSVTFLKAANGPNTVAASDTYFHKARTGLSNRHDQAPLTWGLTGNYEQRSVGGRASGRRASGEATSQYQVNSPFAILARGGYEWIDENTLNGDLSGVYGMAGFLYKPTRRSSLRVEAGYRYGKPNYLGELTYGFGQRLVIKAAYSQGVDNSQGVLNNLFARAGRDAFGNYVDLDTGLPPDPRISAFDFSDQAFRFSRLRAGVQGNVGRNFYSAYGTYETRRVDDFQGESWGAQASLGRTLTRQLSAALEGRYWKAVRPNLLLVATTTTETTSLAARLNYQLNRTVSASVRYVHLKQSTTLVNYRENAAVFTLTKTF